MSEPSEVGHKHESHHPAMRKALHRYALWGRIWRSAALGLIVVVVALGLLLPSIWGEARKAEARVNAPAADRAEETTRSAAPRVDVVRPAKGGVLRRTIQPGSVHAFETVDLFAKVSGFLKTQDVDIGSMVKRGEVLAVIDAPEVDRDLDEAAALLERARAQAEQAVAVVATAEAEREAAAAAVSHSEAEAGKLAANRVLSEKRHDRVRDLNTRNAVAGELVDEHARDVDAARASERAGQAAIRTAKAQAAAAQAKVTKAKADASEARAEVRVAEARLARAQVLTGYGTIRAPFDGVVTRRSFHPGAFIRSAAEGGVEPLLTVSRTDMMRVVVQVPDLDVPLLDPGDRAAISVDAFKGREIEGKVARLAKSEDPTTRTMRTEIDVPNAEGLLVEGMYGRVAIDLQPPNDRLAVPAACVVGHTAPGKAAVFVVRDEKAHRVPVSLGNDDGHSVEILDGLDPSDRVILRPAANLDDGASVSVAASATEASPRR